MILGESLDGKRLCFLFLRQFFTFEYDSNEPDSTFYGFGLMQQKIKGHKIQPIDILLDQDNSMTILTDVFLYTNLKDNEVFIFNRTLTPVGGGMPFEFSRSLVLKALKALIFPVFSVILEDGLYNTESLHQEREWSLVTMRNPGIDGINYDKSPLSMAKNKSTLCMFFS